MFVQKPKGKGQGNDKTIGKYNDQRAVKMRKPKF